MKLKQPPAPQRPRQTTLEGKRSGFMLIAFLLPQDNAAPCGEGLSPEPLAPPVGKETKRGQPASPSFVDLFVGTSTLTSHHGDYRGIHRAQPLGINCDRERQRDLQQPAHGSWQVHK